MEPRFDLLDSPTAAKVAKRFYTTSLALQQSALPRTLQELLQLRVSQINGCGFCADAHIKEAAAAGETPLRVGLVAAWRHTTVFTAAERAALAFAEEGTRVADADEGVSDATWAAVREHYDDDQVGALVCLVALINAATRMGVIVHSQGGSYEPGAFAALA
ncbi:carboxymuconolactone decarboxylase family protein [Streptomyces sp. V4-01]|uniref:Carboxymuconolactone decarboxylase family protein n=1 Tax=Actinacidiphila polyblastidii TaxID=3110430 RepID=A0ABU7P651_9ACTN|nr:carboxymuconolactone decarboxylase family protein [Streptomyces sp. V4-01]